MTNLKITHMTVTRLDTVFWCNRCDIAEILPETYAECAVCDGKMENLGAIETPVEVQ